MASKSKNFYLVTPTGISLTINNKAYLVDKNHEMFNKISKMLTWSQIRWGDIVKLLDTKKILLTYLGKNLKIVDGEVIYTFKGKSIKANPLLQQIFEAAKNKQDPKAMLLFMDNLLANPSKDSIDELFLFLEANNLPITDDGCFLAYKNVGKDYLDKHSHTFDNHIGMTVSMPRKDVNSNRHETCSRGLHFCNESYLSSYPGEHTMILKINPADVVSIPEDYNNAKGRCCAYHVIGELKKNETFKDWFKTHKKDVLKIAEKKAPAKKKSPAKKPAAKKVLKASTKKVIDTKKKDLLKGKVFKAKTTKPASGTKKVLKIKDSKSAKVELKTIYTSIKDVFKRLPRSKRKVGMTVLIENSKGKATYVFKNGISNRDLVKK